MELLQLVNKLLYPPVLILSTLKVAEVENCVFFNVASDSAGMVPAAETGVES